MNTQLNRALSTIRGFNEVVARLAQAAVSDETTNVTAETDNGTFRHAVESTQLAIEAALDEVEGGQHTAMHQALVRVTAAVSAWNRKGCDNRKNAAAKAAEAQFFANHCTPNGAAVESRRQDAIRQAQQATRRAHDVIKRLAFTVPVSDDTKNCAVQDANQEFITTMNAAGDAIEAALAFNGPHRDQYQNALHWTRMSRQAYYVNVQSNRHDAEDAANKALAALSI